MANTLSKLTLSQQADGDGIRIGTASPIDGSDTLLHTAPSGTSDKDIVTLYAYNNHTADVVLHVKWGDTTDSIKVTVPFQAGLQLLVPGLPICDGNTIEASAATIDVVTVYGEVTHIEVP